MPISTNASSVDSLSGKDKFASHTHNGDSPLGSNNFPKIGKLMILHNFTDDLSSAVLRKDLFGHRNIVGKGKMGKESQNHLFGLP